MGDTKETESRNTGILMDASSQIVVKINVVGSKYMKMDRKELNPGCQPFTVVWK
jgi:hypothetical protein